MSEVRKNSEQYMGDGGEYVPEAGLALHKRRRRARQIFTIENMHDDIAERIISAKMDPRYNYLNDIVSDDDRSEFKAHSLGGPNFDDFAVERDPAPGRTVEI